MTRPGGTAKHFVDVVTTIRGLIPVTYGHGVNKADTSDYRDERETRPGGGCGRSAGSPMALSRRAGRDVALVGGVAQVGVVGDREVMLAEPGGTHVVGADQDRADARDQRERGDHDA